MNEKLERATTLAVLAVALSVWMSGCAASSQDSSPGAAMGTPSGGTQMNAEPVPSPSPAATDTSSTPH